MAGGWSMAAGRWWVVAAFLDLLDVEFNIQHFRPLDEKIISILSLYKERQKQANRLRIVEYLVATP